MGDQFPAGLRVLVVDDDRTCLAILKKMLLSCAYNVTTCGMARLALAMLRENRERFDVVLSDVYMPDMDGFKLLELVGLEMDLPVIMMSADGETSLVMKGITHGACDYLLKPIRIKELKNIWQHVIRRKRNILRDVDTSDKRKSDDGDLVPPASTSGKKRKEAKDEDEDLDLDLDDSSALKKPRVVWSVELHQQFVTAVNQLGIDKAVPKRILELMNVQGLTRENVASHLQKYRLYLKRLSIAQHQHQNPVMTIGGGSEPSFSTMDGLQPHPIITPASSQALAALRSAYLRTLCPPSEPSMSGGVEPQSPVFLVRPRPPAAASNQRNLLLGVDEVGHLPQSQMVQIRSTQDGLLATTSTVQSSSLAEQLVQQQQHHSQIQPQQQHYHDFSALKDSTELSSREEGLMSGIPSRSFGSNILAAGGISVIMSGNNGGVAKPAAGLGGMSTGMIKCEETDPLSGWEAGGSSYGGGGPSQLSWQEQQHGTTEFLQTSMVPYTSCTAAASDTLLQQRQEYLGTAICSLGNSFKVKQEHQPYDAVVPSQFSGGHVQDQLSAAASSYRQQDQETGFFESELGLEGYVPGNLYVK